MKEKRLWISWTYQRRSEELAREFGAEYIPVGDIGMGRFKRYVHCLPRTIGILNKKRPGLLFVQNPSILLAVAAAAIKGLYRYRLVNDLHTPYIRLGRIAALVFWKLQAYCAGRSDMTLVTNEGMKRRLPRGDALVLPDRLPELEKRAERELAGRTNILYVSSFAEDEPYAEVRKASRLVDPHTHIYVTGSFRKVKWVPEEMPGNLHLTGYLPDRDYIDLLHSVDAVMVLTTQENCLVCGAYEGVAAGKPIILSNREALRSYFSAGAVFVEDDAASIASGIGEAIAGADDLKGEVAELRARLNKDWRERFDSVEKRLRASPA